MGWLDLPIPELNGNIKMVAKWIVNQAPLTNIPIENC